MLRDRIEDKWIACFERQFRLCNVAPGDHAVILSETQSRQLNVHLSELALLRLGARVMHVVLPTPPLEVGVPVRSTGSTHVLGGNPQALAALKGGVFIADCTVEGLMHAPETPEIMGSGSRSLYVSNDHPESLERTSTDEALIPKILHGRRLLEASERFIVRSDAGSDFSCGLEGARIGGNLGVARDPGTLATWPGGINSFFPAAGTCNGTLVLQPGDINLTFKRYYREPVTLHIENDFVTSIEGTGLDAQFLRRHFACWEDRNAYGVSHLGWGMNPKACWEGLNMYDKGDVNATEQRALAGCMLFSTGANPVAQRFTLGHFDIPMLGCDLWVDDTQVAAGGRLLGELA
jgi:2,5-dihydroxypyridine 5,6-dioxygenase